MRPPERSIELTQVTEWEDGNVRSIQDSLASEEPLEIRIGGSDRESTRIQSEMRLQFGRGFGGLFVQLMLA